MLTLPSGMRHVKRVQGLKNLTWCGLQETSDETHTALA